MSVRREPTRALDNTCQERGFGQREVLDVLVKIGAGGFGQATDREGSALPKRHPVRVKLENLLLGELLLEFGSDQHLRQLAFQGLLRSQEEPTRKLHGNGGAPLLMPLAGDVDPCCFGKANEV